VLDVDGEEAVLQLGVGALDKGGLGVLLLGFEET